ncbi:VOC family protein [Conexibacter stalactiti]|uniref:VOC family protein n=1 Tax=Conexibacter stalactiti TaxID=1940611 RepID=A0ABU4HLE8_9ACTN|nr:VOC family protein [Conexibacter stalactiti]MDW5594102.1 VOC family protein [Conexibacter stalactiti]MEC5034744.1 VOC family protein [Conexibacter stalactiti]
MTHVRFDHVGFTVADIDRAVAWYTRFLQSEPLAVRKGWDAGYSAEMIGYPGCVIDWAYFALPGDARLELVRYVQPAGATVDMETFRIGNGHLCLTVDDLGAELDRLRDFATLRTPTPVRIPTGPNAGGLGAYVRDPDGITIQLMQAPAAGTAARAVAS